MPALPQPDYESVPLFQKYLPYADQKMQRAALDMFLPAFHERFDVHLKSPRNDYEARIEKGDEILGRLQQDGYSLSKIPEGLKAQLIAQTAGAVAELEARIQGQDQVSIKGSQALLTPQSHPGVRETLHSIFKAQSLYDVLGAYCRRPVRMTEHATVQVNLAKHSAAQYGPIDQDGLPANKAQYFHIDSAMWPWIKVLIYLSPVTADQGPFRFVPGSHRWCNDYELVVRKTNDKLGIAPKYFVALPEEFRMNTHFGDYLTPDTPGVDRLMRDERVLIDGESDFVLFDNNGVHRGGFVREGRRHIMQVFVRAKE